MKSHYILMLLAWMLLSTASAGTVKAQQTALSQVSGKVASADNKKPLVFANIRLKEAGISNVSNGEGFFILKFPETCLRDSVSISFLGFRTQTIAVKDFPDGKKIYLEPYDVNVREIVVKPIDALNLLREAIDLIPDNYPQHAMQMTGFYREMIKRGSHYVTLSEAVLDISKATYARLFAADRAAIYKGRGSVDRVRIDTLFVKFRGGITAALDLDVVRKPFMECKPTELEQIYEFRMEPPVQLDGRLHYVVAFDPIKEPEDDVLFRGKVYIETQRKAIARVEFNMNVELHSDASRIFIQKSPLGLRTKMDYATYLVQYKEDPATGRWLFDYSRTELKFVCKWPKKLFSDTYIISSEIAITDHTDNMYKIPQDRRVRPSDIIMDKVRDFTDQDFWQDYNVIEPESGIENVIKRIIKQLKKRQEKQATAN